MNKIYIDMCSDNFLQFNEILNEFIENCKMKNPRKNYNDI